MSQTSEMKRPVARHQSHLTLRSRALLGSWVCLAAASACNVGLLGDLDEERAAKVVVALDEKQIGSRKQMDPAHEGRYEVTVAADDVSSALVALQEAGLPGTAAPGVLDALGDPGLVPTQTNERARLLVGLAGELEASLLTIDGVLSARIHLAVPLVRPLAPKTEAPSASVLLRHRGVTPPLSEQEVQRLVAGAVSGLDRERVNVVMHAVPNASHAEDGPRLAALGPFAVARSSVGPLRWALAAAALLNLGLAGGIALLWTRYRSSLRAPLPPGDPTR